MAEEIMTNVPEEEENTYEAVVERLKGNRFYEHRMEIRKISEEQNVDIGVALDILRDKMNWHGEEAFNEMKAFNAEVGGPKQVEVTRKIFGYDPV